MKRQRSVSDLVDGQRESRTRTIRRRATLFDVVAGRVTDRSVMGSMANRKHRDTKQALAPLRPDEVLYKVSNAPDRFAETDQYFAHRNLPSQLVLPDSDLLASIHAYVSQYCAAMPRNDRDKAWRSMDETALLAMGVLIEETVRESIGETGDLVFVEGEVNDGPSAIETRVKTTPGHDRSDPDV
ncbi:uncharacterized protein BDZ99DRAFT_520242 [Mytilinidion resinicola]|uniref:Uncharacterized protein n=1 Tax=Mytilinidion resinicola TaxID=574789 RepID=A0A6A6YMP5_9PEZI|nr:uncharacterized protein BDZ99DRAFT_520242 [Mytilinidion resinicola]KAF2810152.1 hypothetical protein BDZ99DRAFT_520242 [Mytilinidion resinicola]